MKKRFIHFYLVIGTDIKEAKRDNSVFETRVEPLDPC